MFSIDPKYFIESLKNPTVKSLAQLKEGKNRRKSQTFLVEGAREIARAILGGYTITDLYVCEDRVEEKTRGELQCVRDQVSALKTIGISSPVFEKLAMRSDHDGLLAVAEMKSHRFQDVEIPENPFILIVDRVEKPGNLGALLRSADGAGVDLVILTNAPIDPYSSQTIRSSVGAVFTTPVVSSTGREAIEFLQSRKVTIYSADPDAKEDYFSMNYSKGTAVVLGGEAFGLSPEWKEQIQTVQIPMNGICDSLNVSVAGAVMLYEVVRQRKRLGSNNQ